MSYQHENAVFDFDLDFLQDSVTPVVTENKIDNSRKTRGIKNHLVKIDSLIKNFYEKKNLLISTEKSLSIAREELKAIHIELKSANDKCSQYENEAMVLRNSVRRLQETSTESENRVVASKCFAKQLQTLVAENETRIESLKIENQLQNNKIKSNEKKLKSYQKENESLKKQIQSLLKTKLSQDTKAISKTHGTCSINNLSLSDDSDDAVDYDSTLAPSHASPRNKAQKISVYDGISVPKDDNERDDDSSHEIASADTGCGSSLALSDGEKSFHSPEYRMRSPSNFMKIIKPIYVDVCTSPITVCHGVHQATSPIHFSNEYEHTSGRFSHNRSNNMVLSPILVNDIKITLSPLPPDDDDTKTLLVDILPNLSDNTEVSLSCSDSNEMKEGISIISEPNSKLMPCSSPQKAEGDLRSHTAKNTETNEITPVLPSELLLSSSTQKEECLPSSHRNEIEKTNNIISEHRTDLLSRPSIFDDENLTGFYRKIGTNNDQLMDTSDMSSALELSNSLSLHKPEIVSSSDNSEVIQNNGMTSGTLSELVTSKPKLLDSDSNKMTETNEITSKSHSELLPGSSLHSQEILLGSDCNEMTVSNANISESQLGIHVDKMNICTSTKASVSLVQTSLINNTTTNLDAVVDPVHNSINDRSHDKQCNNSIQKVSELECLELNNSNNLNENHSKDYEIETILRSMSFNRKLLTPIPKTPTKGHIRQRDNDFICKDAIRVQNEHKILRENIATLFREISNMKSILKNKHLLIEEPSCLIEEQEVSDLHASQSLNMLSTISEDISISKNNDDFENRNIDNLCKLPKTIDLSTGLTNDKDVKRLFEVEKKPDKSIANTNSETAALDKISAALDNCMDIDRHHRKSMEIEKCSSYKSNSCKTKKLTKLERIRNKLVTRSKIPKAPLLPTRKSLKALSHVVVPNKSLNLSETAASLNNRDTYEKALQVMLELKSKNNIKSPVSPRHNIITEQINGTNNINNSVCQYNEIIPDTIDTVKPTNTFKDKGDEKPWQVSLGQKKSEECIETQTHNGDNKGKSVSSEEPKARTDSLESYDTRLSNLQNSNNILQCPIVVNQKYKSKSEQRVSSETNEMSKENVNIKPDNTAVPILSASTSTTSTVPAKNSSQFLTKLPSTWQPIKELESSIVKCDYNFNNDDSKTVTPPTSPFCTRISASETSLKKERNNSPINGKRNDENNTHKGCSIESVLRPSVVAQSSRKRQIDNSIEIAKIACKRMLRSSTSTLSEERGKTDKKNNSVQGVLPCDKNMMSYEDLDMFNENDKPLAQEQDKKTNDISPVNPKESILCVMLDKYGKQSVKNFSKKVPDNIVYATSKVIESEVKKLAALPPNEVKPAMNKFVEIIRKWNFKEFVAALMHYLKDPERKSELFSKSSSPPAPAMTKPEQILLYIIMQLKVFCHSFDVVGVILNNIEYVLFKLNRTPEFDTIESISHFYAILCRYFKMKSRLRLFMLDAMYCIQFKALALIKQCLDVWMHVLPLAHMGIAKCPLVMCMVYLLHFYKCEDRFNRVQEIRNILNRKYFYDITDWNEPIMMDMFKNAIKDVKGIPIERKLLRLALIIIAKRHGPKWCQNTLIKNILLPMIENEATPQRVKVFCVSVLGPLIKPYPADMKVHSEIAVNLLLDMLNENPSAAMEEAIFTSLIFLSRHNNIRVIQVLLAWHPKSISSDLESLFRDFVKEKPLKVWKAILSKVTLI